MLHTMVKDTTENTPYEVRHLLIHSIEGSRVTVLTKLISTVQSELATGTEHEMRQKADSVMQEWAEEGFRSPRDQERAWEDLKSTVTLAMLTGHKVVYDPTYRDLRRSNATGAVRLDQWPGRPDMNGGGYHYAFTGTTIIAKPTLPLGHGINMAPSREEFADTIRRIAALEKTVGTIGEFVLG